MDMDEDDSKAKLTATIAEMLKTKTLDSMTPRWTCTSINRAATTLGGSERGRAVTAMATQEKPGFQATVPHLL
jgi:hypothetical protein